mgnify:CR=1 FL=1
MLDRPRSGERVLLLHVGLNRPCFDDEIQEFRALAESAGHPIGYLQWVLANLVFTALQTTAMLLILRTLFTEEDRKMKINTEAVKAELAKLGPFSKGEWAACVALAVALICWTLPDIVPIILDDPKHPLSVWLATRLNWGVVLARQGFHEQAIELFRSVVNLRNESPTTKAAALSEWGFSLALLDRYEEAFGKFRTCLLSGIDRHLQQVTCVGER